MTNAHPRSRSTMARRPHRTTPTLSHDEQAATWYRFLKQLRERPFDACRKRDEALAYSLRLRSRSFVVPSRLVALEGPGLCCLQALLEARPRFVELASRVVQVDADDPAADEVHLCLEQPDRTSSRNRRRVVGRLPQEEAFWMVPLLRLEQDAYGTGPVLQVFVHHAGRAPTTNAPIHIVLARAHEAARQWLDWADERTQCFEALYRSTFYDERAYAPAPA